VDGTVGTNVKIGSVDEFVTRALVLDIYSPQTSVNTDISGTINYTVQACYERPTAGQTPSWGTAIAAGTVDASAILAGNYGAVRILGSSFSAGATVAMNITQPLYAN
jgi:hypothetical protein